MKQAILYIMVLFTAVNNANAQAVIRSQKVLGGSKYDELHGMAVTKDGGIVAAGTSYSNKSGDKSQNTRGGADYWVIKMNKAGKIEWEKTLGGNGNDYCKSVIQTFDGGYLLIGESTSYISVEKSEDSRGGTDYWIIKLDGKGNIEWDKTIGSYGTELIDNVVQTEDGGFVLAGSSDSWAGWEKTAYSRGGLDMWIVKLDKAGTKLWDKTIGGDNYDLCSGIQITKDKGFILAGFSGSNASGEKTENNRGVQSDYWIVKLDQSGNIQWNKTIGGSGDDYGRGVQQLPTGGYIIAGNSNSNTSAEKSENSRGGYDYWIVKLDDWGNFISDKTIGGNNDETDVWCLEKTSDGGFIFGGSSYSGLSGEKTGGNRGFNDYWAVRLDDQLNILWDKTVGGDGFDNLLSIKEISKNQYALGGFSWSEISGDKTLGLKGEADFWMVFIEEKQKPGKQVTDAPYSKVPPYSDKDFVVYPNPAKDIINIRYRGNTNFILSDQTGKILLKTQVNNNAAVSIATLPPGVYYLKNAATSSVQEIIIRR